MVGFALFTLQDRSTLFVAPLPCRWATLRTVYLKSCKLSAVPIKTGFARVFSRAA